MLCSVVRRFFVLSWSYFNLSSVWTLILSLAVCPTHRPAFSQSRQSCCYRCVPITCLMVCLFLFWLFEAILAVNVHVLYCHWCLIEMTNHLLWRALFSNRGGSVFMLAEPHPRSCYIWCDVKAHGATRAGSFDTSVFVPGQQAGFLIKRIVVTLRLFLCTTTRMLPANYCGLTSCWKKCHHTRSRGDHYLLALRGRP